MDKNLRHEDEFEGYVKTQAKSMEAQANEEAEIDKE